VPTKDGSLIVTTTFATKDVVVTSSMIPSEWFARLVPMVAKLVPSIVMIWLSLPPLTDSTLLILSPTPVT
jgi:hypothetical protein